LSIRYEGLRDIFLQIFPPFGVVVFYDKPKGEFHGRGGAGDRRKLVFIAQIILCNVQVAPPAPLEQKRYVLLL
jgi:hypothetical protein